jgi:hypothetical protein
MRTLGLATVTALVSFVLVATSALAGPDSSNTNPGVTNPALLALITNDDVFSTVDLAAVVDPAGAGGTQRYGPYTTSSPDSGTCGNDWANDTFDRHFTVQSNADGTYTVVEQFKNGSFVTLNGASPGACEPPPSGGLITAGKTGTMHGYFIITGVTAQTSTSSYCDAATPDNSDCDTATFINNHFAPCYPVTCTVTTFFFHYAAGDQNLIQHEWKNASSDRGGNSGDIRSS